ncbi:DUF6290 family protein [Limosilactobacillus reuteri]|uniref:type II toxin-antitoxin system RelB family antitoxin n=1 Tax=Limosilactobacillus reuteri TaxID=1598 RepID=UPI001E2F9551|nr:DUF6290 family protein [Limosilactobacillus reuteri]MCC4370489.1 DUF6290 family protein [Limosilactobacillus reuteri]MCC4508237.1 DUF6290 family protein [Limosilactobacillus reuteri]
MSTATKTTSIRFDENVLKMIHEQAQLDGKNTTEFMRDAILDKLEDSLDYADAIKNMRESNGKTVSREEMKKRLGM